MEAESTLRMRHRMVSENLKGNRKPVGFAKAYLSG
jgi:hypothetical protein